MGLIEAHYVVQAQGFLEDAVTEPFLSYGEDEGDITALCAAVDSSSWRPPDQYQLIKVKCYY